MHGEHGGAILDSITDAAQLFSNATSNSLKVAIGDWKVDGLLALEQDPFCDVANRMEHHRLRKRHMHV